jgi:flagellar motor switch protein FliM
VLTLQEGDIITTNRAATGDVPLEVQGREKFRGQLGQVNGQTAIAITRLPQADAAAPVKPQARGRA